MLMNSVATRADTLMPEAGRAHQQHHSLCVSQIAPPSCRATSIVRRLGADHNPTFVRCSWCRGPALSGALKPVWSQPLAPASTAVRAAAPVLWLLWQHAQKGTTHFPVLEQPIAAAEARGTAYQPAAISTISPAVAHLLLHTCCSPYLWACMWKRCHTLARCRSMLAYAICNRLACLRLTHVARRIKCLTRVLPVPVQSIAWVWCTKMPAACE